MWKKRQTLLKFCVSILCFLCVLSSCRETEKDMPEEEAFSQVEIAEAEEKEEPEEEQPAVICVYVCGQVVNPGVYELHEGERVNHAILAAGGMTETACKTSLNLAEILTDGQMIYVPSVEEAENLQSGTEQGLTGNVSEAEDGRVNLNTAEKAELMTLTGIGESRADAILTYRKEHGGFKDIEEIKKIEGIKEGVFNRIKDQITV